MMKSRVALIYLLASALYCNVVIADRVKTELVNNAWQMHRQMGYGNITTVWIFYDDNSGVSHQKLNLHNQAEKSVTHRFTYTTENEWVTVQDEIEKQWEGHFGVTHWRLINKRLVSDSKFRQETPTFTPIGQRNPVQNDRASSMVE